MSKLNVHNKNKDGGYIMTNKIKLYENKYLTDTPKKMSDRPNFITAGGIYVDS
jgi:hypothetical protein